MISFLDGPAEGHNLSLGRAPYFLRVVIDEGGNVDALDQLDDEMRDGETAHVYRLDGKPRLAIVCSRGKGCRRTVIADYLLHSEQPSQEILRDNTAWGDWATNQAEER